MAKKKNRKKQKTQKEEKKAPFQEYGHLPHVVYIHPGSAQDASYKFQIDDATKTEGTIDKIVTHGAYERNVPEVQKQVHGRLREEMEGGYGAQIGDTIYADPKHSRDSQHYITDVVLDQFVLADVKDDIKSTIEQIKQDDRLKDAEKTAKSEQLQNRLKQIEDSGKETQYLKLEMIVAHKLRGGMDYY